MNRINISNQQTAFTARYSDVLARRLAKQYGKNPSQLQEVNAFENKIKNLANPDSRLGIFTVKKDNRPEMLVITLYKDAAAKIKSNVTLRGIEMDEYVDTFDGTVDYLLLFKKYLNGLKLRKLEKQLLQKS